MNRPITSIEIESVIYNFPMKKSPDYFIDEFYQTLKELTPTFSILLKNWKRGNISKSCCEASITLIPKLEKEHC